MCKALYFHNMSFLDTKKKQKGNLQKVDGTERKIYNFEHPSSRIKDIYANAERVREREREFKYQIALQ